MNGEAPEALHRALAFLREPAAPHAPALPDDVRPLLRIAAADATALEQATRATGEPPARLRDAASLFLQRVLFDDEGDSYRVLGASPGVSEERLREHHRWLVRWLHPDRNPDDWEADYLYRVNRAWQDLRTSERRRAFDAQRGSRRHRTWPGPARTTLPSAVFAPAPIAAASSHSLPRIVMGSLGAGAVLGLAWLHALQRPVDEFARVVAGPLSTSPVPSPAPAPAAVVALVPREHVVATPTPVAPSPPASPIDARASTSPPRAMPDPAAAPMPASGRKRLETRLRPPGSALRAPERIEAMRPIARARPIAKAQPVSAIEASLSGDGSHAVAPAAVVAASPAPTPAHAMARPTPSVPPPLDETEARTLVSRFSRAYEAGDVAALAALLTHVDGGSRQRLDMLRAYEELFDASRQRHFELDRVSVVGRGDTGAVIADFSASVIASDRSRRDSSGSIRVDVLREGGELRIYQVRHETRSD